MEPPLKKSFAFLALLAAAPMFAGGPDLSLFLGRQTYNSGSWSLPAMAWYNDYSNASNTVFGFRVGYDPVDTEVLRVNFSAAYQPQIATDLNVKTRSSISPLTELNPDYKAGYTGVGVMFSFKAPVIVGIGLDYRAEKVSMSSATNIVNGSGASTAAGSSNLNRAWFRADLSYEFRHTGAKPFIGLEAALPLSNPPSMDASTSADGIAKSLAPKSQLGFNLGVRF